MLTVTFPARFEELDRAIISLRQEAAHTLPEADLTRFEIAVIEALNNVVLHAGLAPDALIEVTCSQTGDSTTVTIADEGRPAAAETFAVSAHLPDDPLEESGRGIALIQSCADSVDYRRVGDRNELHLVFDPSRPEVVL